MSRARTLTVLASVFLLFGSMASQALAANFSVYYRPTATSPWNFYGGKSSKALADDTAKELKGRGYLTKVIADHESVPAVVGVGSIAVAPRLGHRTGGFRTVFSGGGATVRSATVHHYGYHHLTVNNTNKIVHPTRHPRRNVHAQQHRYQQKKAKKHAHHHAVHHAHHHAHHHSHAHHAKKR